MTRVWDILVTPFMLAILSYFQKRMKEDFIAISVKLLQLRSSQEPKINSTKLRKWRQF